VGCSGGAGAISPVASQEGRAFVVCWRDGAWRQAQGKRTFPFALFVPVVAALRSPHADSALDELAEDDVIAAEAIRRGERFYERSRQLQRAAAGACGRVKDAIREIREGRSPARSLRSALRALQPPSKRAGGRAPNEPPAGASLGAHGPGGAGASDPLLAKARSLISQARTTRRQEIVHAPWSEAEGWAGEIREAGRDAKALTDVAGRLGVVASALGMRKNTESAKFVYDELRSCGWTPRAVARLWYGTLGRVARPEQQAAQERRLATELSRTK
jgi:hypothetical protein